MIDVPTVGVSGHTQQVMDRELDGYRVLTPGSATGTAPAATTSLLVVQVADGDIAVELRLEKGDGRRAPRLHAGVVSDGSSGT